ncbi:ArsR/SmtB family transcription factor [Hymenobacter monticola]|uniref:Metalloregulator ArsR/SmtB family transcription factor n=2 Tax=Hymenobacter TaxID=89966 RepID=A0ABY4BCH0_9BACT|nr:MULTISPECIES: metalloregulator ArsR/SmtB family transcription factor [Hymenobacter]MDU0372316.1 metalloregulator ArsR/SmtB family transcription factor [Hymenobacter endophyticus]UOE36594.1 metalloregulator ArsR/SmtB family transcription factor [Hymenobacter monticola]
MSTSPFADATTELAALAKALGHPARVAIVRQLQARTCCTCGGLVAVLPLSQSTVSQHLKALSVAGLVRPETQGARASYQLDPARWARVQELLGGLFAELNRRADQASG